jgi:hypothetical protein
MTDSDDDHVQTVKRYVDTDAALSAVVQATRVLDRDSLAEFSRLERERDQAYEAYRHSLGLEP